MSSQPPSLLLYNANVITLGDLLPRASWVAASGGNIVGVGLGKPPRELFDNRTRDIDCQGGTIVPGFNDAHCHILPPSFAERRREMAARDATFAAILADPSARIADAPSLLGAMSRDGVDHAVVMGMGWADYQVAVEANDYLIEAVATHPSRITGFASVNPLWGDAAVDETERCFAAGLRGIDEALEPPPAAEDNVFELTPAQRAAREIQEMPTTQGRAIEAFSKSDLMKRVLGEDVWSTVLQNKRLEWDEYRSQVTDYELSRYLAVL